jgi:hypothetical protein
MGERLHKKSVKEFSVDAVVLIADGVTEVRNTVCPSKRFDVPDVVRTLRFEDGRTGMECSAAT